MIEVRTTVLRLPCPHVLDQNNKISYQQQQQQRLFNGLLSVTSRVSLYQKGKTNLDSMQQEIVSGRGVSWVRSYANLHIVPDR